MQINNVTITDIDQIYSFYRIASDYQKAKEKVIVWPDFNRNMVETEIAEHRQFKMLMNNEVVCIWAITFNDEQIWEERNRDSAIYIHRIATNPDFRGRNFVSKIVDWAKEYAKEKGIQFIRLDTLILFNEYSNIIATDNIIAIGLTIPCPAISGADP